MSQFKVFFNNEKKTLFREILEFNLIELTIYVTIPHAVSCDGTEIRSFESLACDLFCLNQLWVCVKQFLQKCCAISNHPLIDERLH